MGNLCCRKATFTPTVYYSPKMKKAPPPPTAAVERTNGTIPGRESEQIMAGEDCAIDELLEGTMDLEVILPDSKRVQMTVERKMPMMDLLIQATTTNKISPGGHVISLSPEGDRDSLHYKPNTPIGSLDTNTIYIMPKSFINDPPAIKMIRSQSQPFERTVRLQVNLPKRQLMVIRVSPKTTLSEIKKIVCTEKRLDGSQHHLVHPTQSNYIIDLNYTLAEYGFTEISLMTDSNINDNICNSTSDLIGYPAPVLEDEKKKKNLLSIFKRKSKSVNNMMLAGEAFKDTTSSRGVSPARSDICDTRSLRTKRQSTKKRPPPPPPPIAEKSIKNSCPNSELSTVTSTAGTTTNATTTVSHSRQSSDSSGYHEASVLSDSPDTLPPETSSGSGSSGVRSVDSPVQHEVTEIIKPKRNSRLTSREKPNFSSVAHSTMLILSTSKKRKAPPPPPISPPSSPSKNSSESNLTEAKVVSPPVSQSSTPIKDSLKTENDTEAMSASSVKSCLESENESDSVAVKQESMVISTVSETSTPESSPENSKLTNDVTVETDKNLSNQNPVAPKTSSPESPVTPTPKTEELSIGFCESSAESELQSPVSEQSNSSQVSTPEHSLASSNGIAADLESPDVTTTTNHCRTEEETGEIIHLLNKGADISTNFVIGNELTDYIPPPLEFATPSPPPEYANTNEKISESVPYTNFNRHADSTKKSFPKPHPRLTLQNSSPQWKKACRRSLNFSDITAEQNPVEQTVINLPINLEIKTIDRTVVETEDKERQSDESTEKTTEKIVKELFSNMEAEISEDESDTTKDPEWDFGIPEPPSPFRNSIDTSQIALEVETNEKQSIISIPEDNSLDIELLQEKSCNLASDKTDDPPLLPDSDPPRENSYRAGSTSSDISPILPLSEPPELPETKNKFDDDENNQPELEHLQNKLENFDTTSSAILETIVEKSVDSTNENYKPDEIITNNQENDDKTSQTFVTVPQPTRRPHLKNFVIRSYKQEIPDNTAWNSEQIKSTIDITFLNDNLPKQACPSDDKKESNKSNKPDYSFTIVPFKSRSRENGELEVDTHKKDVNKSIFQSSQNEQKSNKDQNSFNKLKINDKISLEQNDLEVEYQKLQNQFLAWQQQLIKNQALLQEKQIVPEMTVPALSSLCPLSKVEEKTDIVHKSQTLPRPKPRQTKESVEHINSTVEYHPKSQILTNVKIGSWKNKPVDSFSSGSIADIKPKFQCFETNSTVSQMNGSLGKKSNITIENSTEKFKMPQVSAKFDVKPLHKKTNENENADKNQNLEKVTSPALIFAQIRQEIKTNAKNPAGGNTINLELSRPDKKHSEPKVIIRSKPNITYSHFGATSDNRFKQSVNGNVTKPIVVATIKTRPISDTSNINGNLNRQMIPIPPLPPSQPRVIAPPPPPLPPTVPTHKTNTGKKLQSNQLKVSRTEPKIDPREELMIEIRKFGGRRALRKVPLNQAGWHLKVFGTLSSTSV